MVEASKCFLAIFFMGMTLFYTSLGQDCSPNNYLAVHNEARAMVGVGPLRWNGKLAAHAQRYANKRIKDCALIHSGGIYGENLAEGPILSGAEAVRFWVTEKSDYDFVSNRCVSGGTDCLHYTQIVWRKTIFVGCASVQCENGSRFVICNYAPRGNIMGRRPY
ncbi:Pathogenesis-related protein 1 [Quillaja saponaria]|uniref:Pathogenesis-related protein 1 n=1 Tax=Quillaja saponaria TaxID=32244 RepID=A0AAD7KVJ4_QUISA|nr:Pathogenesis-related protein 1 [Quillaja saponaria]